MTTQANVLSNSVTPLIDRILTSPLTFVPGKQTEADKLEKPASYIVLSKASNKSGEKEKKASVRAADEEKAPEMRKPRSMAEAVAEYTGKKFLSKAEKKAAKRRKLAVQPLIDSEQEDMGEAVNEVGAGMVSDSDSISDSQYESASEFPSDANTDMPFAEFRSESEPKSSSASSESPLNNDNDDDDNDDDDDSDDNADYNDNESEGGSDSASDSEDDVEDNEDLENLKQDLREELQTNPGSAANKGPSLSESEEDYNENEEEDEDKSTTPPTSPEEESEKVPANIETEDDSRVLPLDKFLAINEYPNDRGTNSTRIHKNWGELSKRQPVGLLNHGVTCYMNSAIQSLLHVPALLHYLNDINAGKYSKVLQPRSVSHVLADLSKRMWGLDDNLSKPRHPKYINPKKIIQRLDDINCMMSEWQQEDSHEYYMSLISRLQEDSTPKGVKLNKSIIYDIFGGLLHQAVTCKSCNYVSDTKQEFYDLSLGLNKKKLKDVLETTAPPKYSIERSIQEFFSNELIKIDKKDKSSGYYCENCKQKSNAYKISTIDRSPETLTVHLKRFKFNGNSSSKVKQSISYPKHLDLTNFTTLKDPTKYQLTSVIVHEGRSILSGHYISHCLQPDGTWSTYDDEYINKINEKEALSDPSAYVLVYTKLTPKSNKRPLDGDNLQNVKKAKR